MIRILLITGSLALAGCESMSPPSAREPAPSKVHYLEFVCRDVDVQCEALARTHHVTFGPEIPDLGRARVARAAGGILIGVRAPLATHEQPTIRTYFEVANIADAVASAESAGAIVAYPPTQQGETGTWAIYVLGELQIGLWQR
jgi:hypothetical protein